MISILQARRIFYQHEATATVKSFRFEHSVTLGLRYRIFFIISVQRILNRGHSFSFSPFTADFLLATHWVAFARFSTAWSPVHWTYHPEPFPLPAPASQSRVPSGAVTGPQSRRIQNNTFFSSTSTIVVRLCHCTQD